MVRVVTRHQRGAAAEDVQPPETFQRPAFLLRLLVLGSPVPSAAQTLLIVQQI